MLKILGQRLLRLLATLFAVTFLSFFMTSLLPGDPAVAILGEAGVQNEELLNQGGYYRTLYELLRHTPV